MMKDVEYDRHADRSRGAEHVVDCVAALVVLNYEPGPDPRIKPFAILDEATETFRFVSVDAAQVNDDFMAVIDSRRVEYRSMVLEFFDAVGNHFRTGRVENGKLSGVHRDTQAFACDKITEPREL